VTNFFKKVCHQKYGLKNFVTDNEQEIRKVCHQNMASKTLSLKNPTSKAFLVTNFFLSDKAFKFQAIFGDKVSDF